MALIIKDRVRENSVTSGTGTLTLTGAPQAFQTFSSVIGNGNTTYYTITETGTGNFEVGLGTVGAGTLTRDTVLESSNAGSLVNFGSAAKDVFCTYPAEKAILGTNSAVSSTGTGSVVLSDSPALTGNISANVNLRSDTLANLLPLAGGSSEVGYATDANALVRFNGTAGQAQILGAYSNGGTLTFTLNASNIANLTNPASGVYIDCNNVSYLYVMIDPAIQGTSNNYTNLNIKLPNPTSIPSFKVFIQSIYFSGFWSISSVTITLAYQSGDPTVLTGYKPIAADFPTFPALPSVDKPKFSFNNYNAVEINFVANIQGTASNSYWTRLPLAGEGAYNFNNSSSASIGTTINGSGTLLSLTSGVLENSNTMVLTQGMWLITGYVDFTVSSTLIATEMIAGINLTTSSSSPTINSASSTIRMTANLPTEGSFTITLPPVVYASSNGSNANTRYGNVRATFSAGTISARIYQRAIRIG
jgi:hypothetical protein